MSKTTLIIGASGIIGGAHLRRLSAMGERVVAVSRSAPDGAGPTVTHLPIDLMAGPAALHPVLTAVTHAVYAGFIDAADFKGQDAPNIALFQASLDLMAAQCPNLAHVTLVQGQKIYGSNLGPYKTPTREDDPRVVSHFYFDQQDALEETAAAKGWGWTALRPHIVLGRAARSPMNLCAALGVMASLAREAGEPLRFPGPEAAFHTVCQANDADLLSKAIQWAGETGAQGAYNITNGDFFRWSSLWPRIAALFDLDWEGPVARPLTETMEGAGSVWDALIARHGLTAPPLNQFVSWGFADYVFGITWDAMAHTGKCRTAGFFEFEDTEENILRRLQELRDDRVIP